MWLVIAIVLLIKLPTLSASFCGFDDFNETFRAQFEDSRDPGRILTTPHFDSFKYRPGNRILTLACYQVGQGSAWPFRIRNLALHILNIYLIFLLARRLFGDDTIATTSAFLFGLHHLTHQNIHAAIFTNTFAYALILAGLLASLAIGESRHWLLLAIFAAIANFLSIFSYDPALFATGLLPLYCVSRWLWLRDFGVPWRRLATHTALQVTVVLAVFMLRRSFVPSGMPEVTSPAALLTILVSYAAAIVVPIDLVALQYWLDVSLVKSLIANRSFIYLLSGAGIMVIGVGVWAAKRFGWAQRLTSSERSSLLFLIAAALFAVLPTSLGSPHASETYTYFATALAMIAISAAAIRIIRPVPGTIRARLYWNSISIIILLFVVYNGTRSLMVMDCGNASERILNSLAADSRIAAGQPVRLSRSPYSPPIQHVGLYGYVGLDSIGIGPFASAALRSALSNLLHRTPIDAEVVPADQLDFHCTALRSTGADPACYHVNPDGSIEPPIRNPFFSP
jgi:hypothetical protein